MNIKHGKYLTVTHSGVTGTLAQSLLEHYDCPEYDNTLIIVNEILDINCCNELRFNNFTKKIYLNAEHYTTIPYLAVSNHWHNNIAFPWLMSMGFDEIWDILIENYEFLPTPLQEKFVFVPLRFCHCYDAYRDCLFEKRSKNLSRYDLFFVGTHDTPTRMDTLSQIQNPYSVDFSKSIKFITASGYNCFDNIDLQAMCRFTLDYPHYSFTDQSQSPVRVSEMLCMGNCVIGHVNPKYINYFDGMIIPAYGNNPEEFVASIRKILDNKEPFYDGYKLFQEKTESESAYNEYRKSIVNEYQEKTGIFMRDNVLKNLLNSTK